MVKRLDEGCARQPVDIGPGLGTRAGESGHRASHGELCVEIGAQ